MSPTNILTTFLKGAIAGTIIALVGIPENSPLLSSSKSSMPHSNANPNPNPDQDQDHGHGHESAAGGIIEAVTLDHATVVVYRHPLLESDQTIIEVEAPRVMTQIHVDTVLVDGEEYQADGRALQLENISITHYPAESRAEITPV